MIITICGPPGSGKDTVANILLSKLCGLGFNYELLSIGDIKRIAAQERNMTISEFNEWAYKHPKEGDYYFENFQREYAKKSDNFVLVSRLGWYAIPHSFKVYISVDEYEGAKRIFLQKEKDHTSRNEQFCKSIEEQIAINKKRKDSEEKMYYDLYKANPHDLKNFDCIIDSTHKTPDVVVLEIFEHIKDKL